MITRVPSSHTHIYTHPNHTIEIVTVSIPEERSRWDISKNNPANLPMLRRVYYNPAPLERMSKRCLLHNDHLRVHRENI